MREFILCGGWPFGNTNMGRWEGLVSVGGFVGMGRRGGRGGERRA